MRLPLGLVALLLVAAVSGCVDDPGPAAEEPTDELPLLPAVPERPPVPDVDAEEAALPVWLPGDWWTWRFDHAYLDSFEVTTIVSAADAATYRIGSDELLAGLRAQWYHVLPSGIVDRAALAWTAHDDPLGLVSFPLEDGKQWTGSAWFADEVRYTAQRMQIEGPAGPEPGFFVTGFEGDDEAPVVAYAWSLQRGTFTHIGLFPQVEGWLLELTLLDQGTGATGPVFVPVPFEVGFVGFAMPDPQHEPLDSAPPSHSFEVGAPWTHIVGMCVLGNAEGAYSIDFIPPEGEGFRCAHTNMPGESARHFEPWIVPALPGTYRTAHTAAGEGFAFAEVLGVVVTEEPVLG